MTMLDAIMNGSGDATLSSFWDIHKDTTTDDIIQAKLASNITTPSGEAAFLPWDNPHNLMTLQQYKVTAIITNCVLSPILLVIGAPTNLISCLVFYRQGLKDRMNLCLFVLGLIDTIFLASSFIVCLNSFIGLPDEQLGQKYYANILVNFGFVMFAAKAVSSCISVVVAVERCVCVVYPLRASSIMRARTMALLLAAITFTLFLGYSIMYFRNHVASVYDAASGRTYYTILVTDYFVTHHLFYDVLHDMILSFLLPIVTFVVVGVATAVTVIKLRTAMAWRAVTSSGKADNQGQQQQAALTKMLVVLSCVFMACSAPLMSLGIVRYVVPDFSAYGRYSNFFFAYRVHAFHSARQQCGPLLRVLLPVVALQAGSSRNVLLWSGKGRFTLKSRTKP